MAELFDKFEINKEQRWPRLARTVAGSLVVHALLVAAVLYVPTLRSALKIAGMLSDADYVEEDYTLADIKNATIIRFSREKLYYPPGYFTLNPNAPVAEVKEVQPKPTPRPTPKPKPSPEATPEVARNADAQGDPAGADADAQADGPKSEEELNKLADESKVKRFPKVNTKPFKDLLAKSKEMMERGELDLSGSITMTVEANRNDDGTLSDINVVHVSTKNPRLSALAIEFIRVLGASRALAALEGTRRLRMTVESTPARVSAVVTTRAESAERAREMETGYNFLLMLARMKKAQADEGAVYQNTKISARGDTLTLTFGMSRPAVTKMLAKHVPAAAAAPAPSKPAEKEPATPTPPADAKPSATP
ncbi:MAG TPA: hypothetical protein VEQ42_06860 [Pyrinomonadaceae bacterium]|nr:hypothetical protein [Pyrinomonadaceae bacterium]